MPLYALTWAWCLALAVMLFPLVLPVQVLLLKLLGSSFAVASWIVLIINLPVALLVWRSTCRPYLSLSRHVSSVNSNPKPGNPRGAYSPGPPVWRGGSWGVLCRHSVRTLEQLQLYILAMQLLIAFCTALLLDILANGLFVPVQAYGTDEIAFGPKFAPPQTLFDGRDTVKDFTGRETFDHFDNLGRAIAQATIAPENGHDLCRSQSLERNLIPFGDV